MSVPTVAASDPTFDLPDRLHALADAAQLAGWGVDGPDPEWLDEIAVDLFVAAHGLQGLAASARRVPL